MNPLQSVDQLRRWWLQRTHSGALRLCLALIAGAAVAAVLLARQGLPWSRPAALFTLLLGCLPALMLAMKVRRQRRDERAVMQSTVMRTEPHIAQALLRAVALSHASEAEEARGSLQLARAHLQRLFGRIDRRALEARAERIAWLASGAAVLLAAVALLVAARDPLQLVEGANVMLSRDGVAPMTIRWLEQERVVVEPPTYLGMQASRLPFGPTTPLHIGSEITVRGRALYAGRELVLTDGHTTVAFVSDGGRAVVARWRVTQDASLKLAARFGDTRIESPTALRIHALPDYHPNVRLEGAPRQHRLLAIKRIPIHWEVMDDHGISKVVVVLRAGGREDIREVSEPRGGATVDRGGIDLLADDPFLQRSYLPIEVTVQARDNDAEGGPNLGVSESITLFPPAIGERQAMRYRALRRGRDALTLLLAQRLSAPPPSAKTAARYRREQRAGHDQAQAALTLALDGRLEEHADSAQPLGFEGPLAALLVGQAEALRKALELAIRRPNAATHQALIEKTERALLAVDSALDAGGARDTRRAAGKLSEVATDALGAMALAGEPQHRARAQARLRADMQVLREGGGFMLQLGWLGRDLGETVINHLGRVERAWQLGDRFHARLAMQDLLARLRAPSAAMQSSGGGGGRKGAGGHQHGVEAGGSAGAGDGEPASKAAQQADEISDALEQLRQEHAAERDAAEQALDNALSPAEREQLQQTLKETAQQIRQAVKPLPKQAADPESARADAARGRAQAEAAASALERGASEEAARRAKEAMESLQSAERKGANSPSISADAEAGKAAAAAGEQLRKLMEQADKAAKGAQGQASKRADKDLRDIGKRVSELAERAAQLGDKSRASDAPLPQRMLNKLQQAAKKMAEASRALKAGKGQKALELQRQAQRLLEMALPETQSRGDRGSGDGDSDRIAQDAEIPGDERSAEAEAFRKRVTDGLNKSVPPHLREALRRYTEGLIR